MPYLALLFMKIFGKIMEMIVKYRGIDDVVDDKKGYTEAYLSEHAYEIVNTINKISQNLKQVPLPNGNKVSLPIEISYNPELITQILIDAIEDLKRIHDFHPINNSNAIKEAAYIGFWWQRRKPVFINGKISSISIEGLNENQLNKIKAKLLFINELCITHYVRPKIFNLVNGSNKLCSTKKNIDEWNKARDHFIYFLAYRAESPKSVEEMLMRSTLHPIWPTKQDFWNVSNEK